MPLVDDRGRVAGRLNLIDAAVLLTVAVLIPLAYAPISCSGPARQAARRRAEQVLPGQQAAG